jgi:hypothetical protein
MSEELRIKEFAMRIYLMRRGGDSIYNLCSKLAEINSLVQTFEQNRSRENV